MGLELCFQKLSSVCIFYSNFSCYPSGEDDASGVKSRAHPCEQ